MNSLNKVSNYLWIIAFQKDDLICHFLSSNKAAFGLSMLN